MEKKTAAPSLYTEASLLSAMENAGKVLDNVEARKILQQVGIGTPAKRASIIETLFSRDYIKRDKKALVPTEKGLQVYELVKEKKIGDAVMTAEWELALQKIENGQANSSAFQKEMETYASAITRELLNTSVLHENLPELFCPKYRNQVLIRDKIVKCPNERCGWLQYRNVCGVQLSISDIESLLVKGKTPLIKGMKSKAGKKFNALIILNQRAETSFEFEPNKPKKQK
jgi:DNA topoisomerase-3